MKPPTEVPLLSLESVSKHYGGVTALRNLSLEVFSGEFIALFGPNGAGKSTLLRVLASLIKPDSGSLINTQGEASRRNVGYVSHQSLLYNELTGFENLLFYSHLYGLPRAKHQVEETLEAMGLSQVGGQMVRGYSRGMKQRLTLGRALLHDPPLLLLDEPYTGLDRHGGRTLTETLGRLKARQRTILLVTHNLREGLDLCSRVLILSRGQVAFDAPRNEVDSESFEDLYFLKVDRKPAASAVH